MRLWTPRHLAFAFAALLAVVALAWAGPAEEDLEAPFDKRVTVLALFEDSVLVQVKDETCTRFIERGHTLFDHKLDAITDASAVFVRGPLTLTCPLDPKFQEEINVEVPEKVANRIQEYENRINQNPEDEGYYYQMASMIYEYRPAQAYAWIMRAYATDPMMPSYQIMRSICMLRLKAYAETVEFLKKCIADGGTEMDDAFMGIHHYNLACAYSLNGELKKAVAELRTGLTLVKFSRSDVENDPDFNNLHDLPEYQEILNSLP